MSDRQDAALEANAGGAEAIGMARRADDLYRPGAEATGGRRSDGAASAAGSRRPSLSGLVRRTFPSGKALHDEQWGRHHGYVLYVLTGLALALFFYALLRGHGVVHATVQTAPLVALTLLARARVLPRAARSGSAAMGLMTAAGLVVHVSEGATEAHFAFFALLPLAALYAARAPFLLAVGYVAVHHFILGSLAPGSVFEPGQPALPMAALHAGFVLVESWACLVAWRLFEDRRELVERLVLERTAELGRQRDALSHLAAAVRSTGEAVITTTIDGVIRTWNPGAERLYGYSPAEVVGRHVDTVFPSDGAGRAEAVFAALAEAPSVHFERLHLRRDGTAFESLVTVSPIVDDSGATTGFAAISRDISEQKRTEVEAVATARQLQEQAAELTRLALHDPLTGLANRALMDDRLTHALAGRGDRRTAVLLLDLDDFKSINDVFGHGVGDAVLVEVARRLQRCVRPGDTVARLGGDEFVVLLEDLDGPERCTTVAARLLEALVEPIHVGGERFVTGGSVGIALRDGADARGPSELLQHADIAMYVAKTAGKNRYQVFEPGMHDEVVARSEVVRDLREGIADGQLRLVYQPQVELATGRVTGVEALVRWQRRKGRLTMPETFISAAESSGLINAIDDWVLREACTQVVAWDEAGLPPLRLAVNVSARRLTTGGLPGMIAELTRETGLAPDRLEIEITETSAVRRGSEAAKAIRKLRALGVHVAVDDFGMGHSSLSRLQAFSLDRLKIDKSFIASLVADAAEGSIAGAMIAMGRSLGLDVVAEGVETEEQLAALRSLGCRTAQGYLFARPAPAADIERLLRADPPGLSLTAMAAASSPTSTAVLTNSGRRRG
jgi:diguanylate cyclase (GGDEF)-like protein/PAS domain S-box-containing protein